MADPMKHRLEILDEITRLGKLQKKAIRKARLKNGSPLKSGAYDERGRHIARLVAELVDLDETGGSKIA
jgi:hypothetical protein